MLRVIETINGGIKTPRAAIMLAVLPACWQIRLALAFHLSIFYFASL
jgi:hypothetical protein